MRPDEPVPPDEAYTSLFAAGEDALVTGQTTAYTPLPTDLEGRLEEDLACVRLLRQVLRRPDALRPEGLPWESLGRFQLRRVLGRGGFGVVYLAYDPLLGREVALKVPRAEVAVSAELRERFHTEARAAAGLDHPNLVPVYEVGEVGPVCFLVSAYCPGVSLAQGLRERTEPVPFREAAELLATLAGAVQHAHERGVVHRDLKPGNILLQRTNHRGTESTEGRNTEKEREKEGDKGHVPTGLPFSSSVISVPLWFVTPKITDFGLAKLPGQGADLTRSGAIVGTVQYMAPEQAAGRSRAVGPAADLYALGAILYELLTGRPPFQGETELETLQYVQTNEPVPPSRLRPKLPRDLETICLKCLRKESSKRYASAADLADDVRRFLDGRPILARPVGRAERLVRWCRRNPSLATALGLGALAAVAMFAYQRDAVTRLRDAAEGLQRSEEQTRTALGESRQRGRQLQEANQVLLETDQRRLRFTRLSASLVHERAVTECARGDVALGMLWLGRCLDITPPDDPELEFAIRMNLAGWRPQSSALRALLPHRSLLRVPAAYSPDGRMLLTGSGDGIAWRWRADDGQPLEPPLVHPHPLWNLAFSPDGKTIMTASDDCAAWLWEAATGRLLCGPLRHPSRVNDVAFTPDGTTMLTVGAAKTIHLWDVATGAARNAAALTPEDGVLLAYSPDASAILTVGPDNSARVLDPATGKLLGPPLPHKASRVHAAALSPKGRFAVTVRDSAFLYVWDVPSGQRLHEAVGDFGPRPVLTFSPDGETVVYQSRGAAHFRRVSDGRVIGVTVGEEPYQDLVFSADGRTFLTRAGFSVRFWKLPTDLISRERLLPLGEPLQHASEVKAAALSPDGRFALTCPIDTTARLWQLPAARPRWLSRNDGIPSAADLSGDGRFVLAGYHDGRAGHAQMWDAADGRALGPVLSHSGTVHGVAVSPDGGTLATACEDGAIRLWNAATGQPLGAVLQNPKAVIAVAFARDGKTLLAGGSEPAVLHWDVATGQLLQRFRQTNVVTRLALSPDGRTFASAGMFDVILRDVATGKTHWYQRQLGTVAGLAFSPDGKTLVTGSYDRTARFWDVATGKPTGLILQHPDGVLTIAFSPDGRMLLTGCKDGMARLWDPKTGRPLGPPAQTLGPLRLVAFYPNGRSFLTVSADQSFRVWEVPAPLEGDAERITLWTQVLTGRELDDTGAVRFLDAPTWQQRRQRLLDLGGPPVP